MADKTRSVRVGTGPLNLLGIAFVVLKLTHYIDWSWWWVTCPFWIIPAFILLMLVFAGGCAALSALVERS